MACGVLQTGAPPVQAEALACLQQLHMFAPSQVGSASGSLACLLLGPGKKVIKSSLDSHIIGYFGIRSYLFNRPGVAGAVLQTPLYTH